jgi:hypothetical protein
MAGRDWPRAIDRRGAVGVVGFGRCGSSMVMQMLAAGGVPLAGDPSPGSLELPGGAEAAHTLDLSGTAVKLLDSVAYFGVPAAPSWRFVWLDRDPIEQSRSHLKFIRTLAPVLDQDLTGVTAESIRASYSRDRARVIGAYRQAGYVLVMRYERVLLSPGLAARALARHIWPDLDVAAAAAVVHERDGRCRPDMTVEETSAGVDVA